MGIKTKIDWCDSTWNPVTGCLYGCEYCYARKITKRFGWEGYGSFHYLDEPVWCGYGNEFDQIQPYPFGFDPTFHRYKLGEPQHWKKPRNILVGSMADLFGDWVPEIWIREVFKACDKAPQHRYLFLTKNPNRYISLAQKGILPQEHWYGYSATKVSDLWQFHHADDFPYINLFVSLEPIHQPITTVFSTHCPADWIIVGAETGNKKGKIKPKREWITDIAAQCEYSGKPIFMKESLRDLMGTDFKQQYPWADGLRGTKNGGAEDAKIG